MRDSRGFYKESGQSRGSIVSTVLKIEFQALLMAMQQAWIRSYRHIVFEEDNKMVYNLLSGKEMNFGVHNWIRDIKMWSLKFDDVKFQWTSLVCNKATDRLAKEPLNPLVHFVSMFYVPNYLVQILHGSYFVFH